jgi:hypothetical protein
MLENIDIKLIALIAIILLIGIGYLVYSLYKDLVFLKSQINSGNPVLEFQETEDQEDDSEEDEELERHLQSIMEEARNYEEAHHHHSVITEIEPEIQMVELPQAEPEVKKRKSKKKVVIKEPEETLSLNLDESIDLN